MTTMFIDTSVLKEMIEDTPDANKMLKLIKVKKDEDSKLKCITTQSCFLRAIYLADSKKSILNVQKIIGTILIIPSVADYDDEKEIVQEMFEIVKKMGGCQ
jgi:predicted nucleic acid-binding protein